MRKKTLKKPIVIKIGKKKYTIKRIELAPDCKIVKRGKLAYEFLWRVFGIKGALLTDLSSLYDFDSQIDFRNETVKHETEMALKKIKKIYGVDVSDIKGLVLYKILDRIKKHHEHQCP